MALLFFLISCNATPKKDSTSLTPVYEGETFSSFTEAQKRGAGIISFTLDFDAEEVESDAGFLIIYANQEKRKVKKSDLKFTFTKWRSN